MRWVLFLQKSNKNKNHVTKVTWHGHKFVKLIFILMCYSSKIDNASVFCENHGKPEYKERKQ